MRDLVEKIASISQGNILLTQRTRIWLWIAVLITGLMGIVNLLSAVSLSYYDRTQLLDEFFPFPLRAGGHIFAAITGFMLLMLSTNLLRRKRVAWLLTVGLLVVSILSHLIKGLDYEESILAAMLLMQLILMRNVFTASSDRPAIAQGIKVLIGSLLFTLAYGIAGFYLLDRQFSENFNLSAAAIQTLAMFFTEDNAGLRAKTQFGEFFANSIYLVGAITLSYAVVMLLRPVLARQGADNAQWRRAKGIATKYGKTSLTRLALLEDKSYYFSPTGESAIAYVAKGRSAIALGDPIGANTDVKEAIIGFQHFCDRNDWYPAFYQTLPDNLDLYKSLGFRVLQIGEEAIVNLATFSLTGKANQNLRTAINRLTKTGHKIEFYTPPIADSLLVQLKEVSNEWLQLTKGGEKHFSVGWFTDEYVRGLHIAVVHSHGNICAFASVFPAYQGKQVSVDLMRRRLEVENGTMEFLFASMLQHFQQLGYDSFNLGLSALAGVGDTKGSPHLEQGLRYLSAHLSKFYNFKGLHSFKDKFQPQWQPRYLVYPGLATLPNVVLGLIRADSGEGFWNYFKPDI
ncbi:phosphatidylglycerol lysyltransferase domain-containing protein [Synechocystis sp. PCC 7509]|uniref:phosphatidylglycerol lysyltransferase domain-containing protein n=1 Tax=Synechocystis sp. PCC 7509 TaxID=927677 RepID=UPI0002ACB870|nr:phosphatidylglycerol lysyltransferase domain-containing protein [Synechocystis sp. PCC 7509]